MTVPAATALGSVIPLAARVLQSTATIETGAASLTVAEATPLALTLGADTSPAAPGAEIEYVLTFGNRSQATLSDLALSLALPAGTSFVSASEGGILDGSNIEWTISSLPPGLGTTRRARVQVDAPASNGSLLSTTATLAPRGDPASEARARLVTRVTSAAPLVLGMVANPDPAKPNSEFVEVELTAANRGIDPLVNVVVEGRIPTGAATVSQQHLTGSGTCPSGSNTTFCDPGERVLWNVGTLGAGQGVTVVLGQLRGRSGNRGQRHPVPREGIGDGWSPGRDVRQRPGRECTAPRSCAECGSRSRRSRRSADLHALLRERIADDLSHDLTRPPAPSGRGAALRQQRWEPGRRYRELGARRARPRAGDVRWARVQLPPGIAGELVKPVAARLRDTTSVLDEARASALARTAHCRDRWSLAWLPTRIPCGRARC